jgi:hypothetical protein
MPENPNAKSVLCSRFAHRLGFEQVLKETHMIIDILLEEAIRLIRPCTWLVPEPNSEGIAAVWGGDGIVNPPVEPHEHLMTFDCRFLPSKLQDITGCISVYQDEDDEIAELVRHESTFKLPLEMSSSIKLYPFRTTSLPPIEAIFRYGSDNTKDQLTEHGWDGNLDYTFPDKSIEDAYLRAYQAQNPLYIRKNVFAILGGWHFPWADGDWEELSNQELLLWTFQDAEPWVEVWRDENHKFRRIGRIT